MGLDTEYIDRQTPLDQDKKENLIFPTITTCDELDEFEQQNIKQAISWSPSRSFRVKAVFSEDFIKAVYKRMYGNIWAGVFHQTCKNTGLDKWQIPTKLTLFDNVKFWYANNTYSLDYGLSSA